MPGSGGQLCGLTEKAIAAYGEPTGIEDFCRKAQMVNMEIFKVDLRGVEQQAVERLHRGDDLDEQPLLAVAHVEHLRLLPRTDGGLLRLQEGLRADPRPVEHGLGRGEGRQ